jgi:uncharacterized protein (DUF1330 family)
MTAYLIVDITVTDPVRYEEYRRLAGASVAAHGGTFLVRGGALAKLEGAWQPQRMVVIEFPSVEQARSWYDSPQYRAAREARAGAALMHMILAEGAA